MNKIIVNLGNFKLDEIPLHRGSLNIGRAEDNDISLADAATSSHHAKIVTIFTSSFIQDLNSTNGTIVNGRKVVRHTLHHGDVISIGNLQLLFKSDAKGDANVASTTTLDNKEKLNSIIQSSSEPQENNDDSNANKEELSGFSIAVPTSTANTVKVNNDKQNIPESMIPLLEETLPLDELRKNPDRTVVLTPAIKTGEPPSVIGNDFHEKSKKNVLSATVNDNQMMSTLESERTIAFEDEQIRKLLSGENYQNYSARIMVRLAFGILLVVVVVTSVYLLI